MSASANPDNDAPVPCANDCGFWGRPSTGNYCSSCYKLKLGKVKSDDTKTEASLKKKDVDIKELKKETKVEKSELKDLKIEPSGEKPKLETADKAKATEEEKKPAEPIRKVQKNRMRCFACRKKIGLTGTECRCGYVFCGSCRYPEEHDCDFDFQTLAQEKVKTKSGGAVVDKIQGEKL